MTRTHLNMPGWAPKKNLLQKTYKNIFGRIFFGVFRVPSAEFQIQSNAHPTRIHLKMHRNAPKKKSVIVIIKRYFRAIFFGAFRVLSAEFQNVRRSACLGKIRSESWNASIFLPKFRATQNYYMRKKNWSASSSEF